MFWVLLAIVLLLAIAMIVMVLLQPSKSGGSMGSAFGGMGTSLSSTFGARRTLDFLAKGTTYVAAAIALLCIFANLFFIPHAANKTNIVTTGAPVTTPSSSAPTALPGGSKSAPAAQGGATQGGEQPAAGTQQAPAAGQPANGGQQATPQQAPKPAGK